ncbi:MAG: hypothetical protein DRJ03_10005 [Chloroflexi bacterium]|nr:MAG: hypothetical protein DRJ03_10005 [Chloroflexota bacterium]
MKKQGLRLTITMGLVVSLLIGSSAHSSQISIARAAEPSSNRALILLAPGADLNSTIKTVELTGGCVTHIFPPAALIGNVPVAPDDARAVYRQAVNEAALVTLTGKARRAAQVWNQLLASESSSIAARIDTEIVNDALAPPPPERTLSLASVSGSAQTPNYYETSEYFIGRVAVGIVLPESDGSADSSTEDWNADERALVLSEITAALDWWAALEPNAHLTFVYDDGTAAPIATGYEPISRPASDQSLWITEIMEKKGYTGPSHFGQVRDYNNALREAYDTDWAFTIFVVDSSNDGDNRFADHHFAYAYLGGPFFVMTYGNSTYGPNNMDAVAAHETGHIFFALDQYYSAHQPCTRQAGYLGVENQNSEYGGCASDAPSIMRGHTPPYRNGDIDAYARGQIGWRDSDGDGILDPVDTTLNVISSDYVTATEQPNVLTFTGSVRDDPFPSPLRRDTVINTIEQVQYRWTGGKWTDAQPADGAFDTYTEAFTFTTPPLPTGDLDIDLRVVDSAGNELIQTLATIPMVDPVDAILDTTLTQAAQQAAGGEEQPHVTYNGQGISTISYIAGAYYRIDDGPWQPLAASDGAFDEPQEDFTFTIDLATLNPGLHQIQARSMDGAGNTETSPAGDSIFVQLQTHSVFLPLVLANK